MNKLSLDFHHPFPTVSAITEELLHVWVYSAAWDRRGYVQYRDEKILSCEIDLYTIASQMTDEYVVNRRKTEIFGQVALFQSQPGSDMTGGRVLYGGSVVAEVPAGLKRIGEILKQRFDENSTSSIWNELLRVLYRGVFEPLARNAAYEDAYPDEDQEDILHSIPFYPDLVSDTWSKVHSALQDVYENNLKTTEGGLDEIVAALRDLLRFFGVTYRRQMGEG